MTKKKQLNFNHSAPDLTLLNTAGEPVQLSSLWAKQPLLLAFTRHFGCTQCKEMLEELVHGQEQIRKAGLGIAVITQGTPQSTAIFAKQYGPGLFFLSDTERKAYQAYGLERANIWQTFLSLNVWRSNRRLKKERGWNTDLPPKGQDAMQMAGTFIIGPDGRIRLPYYYDDIADHPPVELLLRGIMGMDWATPLESPIDPENPNP